MHILSALLLALQISQADTAHVVIVATTDVHGRVLGWDYVRDTPAPGGLSRAATALETLRARYPGMVVLVDAGDLLQGNPFATYYGRVDPRQPNPIVDALNALQYDVVTPGNHDFDFGVEFLRRAAAQATYRYVSGNVYDSAGAPLFPQTVTVQRGNVKIGVTGFTTPGVMLWDRSQLAGKATVRRIGASAPAALAQLQAADLRVVLTHSGFGESTYDTTGVGAENDAAALASLSPKPDIVIVGHTHREVRDTVINGVHFVQPKNWAQSLAVIHVWLQRDAASGRYRVTRLQPDLISLANVAEHQRFARRFDAVQQAARLWLATPIGRAGPGFDGRLSRAQDTPLLDFINEVQRRQAGAQLSAAAAFDVQAGLSEGEIHQRDVSGIYPYENTLRAVKISGQQLREFLEHSARYYRSYAPGVGGQPLINDSVAGYNFDVVSGVVYNIDLSRQPGQRVRGLAYENKIVQPTDSFTMAVNSYRQAGGGGYTMLARAPIVYDKGEDIRDLLVNEIRRAGTLQASAYLRPSWAIIPDSARAAARAAFAAAAPPVVRLRDSTLLRVLTITDLHGQLESRVWDWSQGRPVGGVAALKPWLDSLARVCGCTSIRLDAGDEMQGTALSNVTYGRGTVAALSALGIDAAAIGNHEFDWSIDTLRQRMREAKYPFVSANITTAGGSARPDWATPWTLITKYGTRIAVIGLTTTETPTATAPRNVRGLSFGDGAAAIKRYLPEARAQADFVIVAAHAGAVCDSGMGGACHGEILDIARQLDSGSVDLIVAGHSHQRVNTVVNGIPIVQAQANARSIGVVDFVRRGGRREVRIELVTPYADQVRPDPALVDALGRQQQSVRNITERTVGRLKFELKREGGEYGLGRMIAEAQRSAGRADAAIMNNGGIRADLPAGPVTWGMVYQVQPFQNRLQRLTVQGAVLQEALEHCVSGNPDRIPDCHIAGLEVWYDARKPAGKRIERIRFDNRQNLAKDRSYTLVVSDFMATGGSGFQMLAKAPREDLDVIDVDALIRYMSVLRPPVEAPAAPRFHPAGR